MFDMVDEPLRDMPVEIRLLEDTGTKGVNTTFSDLGSPADIEQQTVILLPYVTYPKGTVVITHEFLEPGKYIGLVQIRVPDKDEAIVSVFPFSVGITSILDYWPYVAGLFLFVVAGGVIRLFWK